MLGFLISFKTLSGYSQVTSAVFPLPKDLICTSEKKEKLPRSSSLLYLFKMLYSNSYLLANIIVVEERLKKGESIENPKNYLRAAFTKDFRKKKTEFDKIQEQKEQAKLLQLEKEEQKYLEMTILKWTFEEESRAELSKIKQWLSDNQHIKLKEEFRKKMQSNSFYAKWFEHHTIKWMWNGFLTIKLLAKKYHSFENYKQEISLADTTSIWQ